MTETWKKKSKKFYIINFLILVSKVNFNEACSALRKTYLLDLSIMVISTEQLQAANIYNFIQGINYVISSCYLEHARYLETVSHPYFFCRSVLLQ